MTDFSIQICNQCLHEIPGPLTWTFIYIFNQKKDRPVVKSDPFFNKALVF